MPKAIVGEKSYNIIDCQSSVSSLDGVIKGKLCIKQYFWNKNTVCVWNRIANYAEIFYLPVVEKILVNADTDGLGSQYILISTLI